MYVGKENRNASFQSWFRESGEQRGPLCSLPTKPTHDFSLHRSLRTKGGKERKGKVSPRFSLIYAESVRNFSSFFFLSRERGVGGKSGPCNRDRGSKSLRILTSTVARPRTPFIYDPRKLRNPCVYGRVTARLATRLVSPFSSLQTELNPAQSFLLLSSFSRISRISSSTKQPRFYKGSRVSRVNFPTTFPRDPELFSFSGALLVARMTRKGRGKKRTNELGCLAFKERRRTKERSLRSSASTLAKKFILASGERKKERGEGARIERARQDGGN